MDEDQNSEEVEVTPQDQVSDVEEPTEEIDKAEDPQERNFRNLRKKAEEAEKEARQFEAKSMVQEDFIKGLLSQSQQQVQQTQVEVDEFADIPEDEYLTKGQSQRLNQKVNRQIAREEYLKMEKERESFRFKERLQDKYSDFDDIVNSETIANFEKREPELASTIADLKDPYKMGLQTYNFIKSMGLTEDGERHAKEVKKNIEKNEKSVQTPQAYNKRPMAQAFNISNMSKDEKQKIYEEMMGYASQTPGY